MGAAAKVPVTKLQAPLALTVAVPNWVDPSSTVTVLLAVPAPVKVSVVAFVMPSPTVPLSGENDVIEGAEGVVVAAVRSFKQDRHGADRYCSAGDGVNHTLGIDVLGIGSSRKR